MTSLHTVKCTIHTVNTGRVLSVQKLCMYFYGKAVQVCFGWKGRESTGTVYNAGMVSSSNVAKVTIDAQG